MEKLFYTAKDVSEILNYGLQKSYSIIKQLNAEMLMEFDKENSNKPTNERKQKPVIFPGRINKKYFDKKIGI